MIRISLTDFVDIVSKSGTPKATKIAQVKNRVPYNPAADFYKVIRDTIIEMHSASRGKAHLRELLSSLVDQKKASNYPGVVDGYLKWWGRKTLEWFTPPSGIFSDHGMEVSINPELGLNIDGQPHVIKLYFKSEPLSKMRVDIATHLMEVSLRPNCHYNEIIGVLDTRRSRFITSSNTPVGILDATIHAELSYIAAVWPKV